MKSDVVNTNNLLSAFLRYVQVDTEADPNSNTIPSSKKQLDLSRMLTDELLSLGLKDVLMTEEGYVFATIPSNSSQDVPTICFCAHVDTAPDCSGKDVKPIVHRNYQGDVIILPDDTNQILDPDDLPYLKECIGHDIITASGKTLLGADDKSGVAIIMELANYLTQNPQVLHGDIRIFFTTDEEVGRGVDHLDMDVLDADYGYTLDGGQLGSYEDETFSANMVTLTIHGRSIHPAYAKNVMESALKIGSEIITALPKTKLSPESTEGREGFIHPFDMNASMEKTIIRFLIRDFITAKLKSHEELLESIVKKVISRYPNSSYQFDSTEQYRNMHDIIINFPEVSEKLELAIEQVGLVAKKEPIRGGTDGSRLSYMGLPCPNIFTGMQEIHSKKEWISLQVMQKSVETLIALVQIWEGGQHE